LSSKTPPPSRFSFLFFCLRGGPTTIAGLGLLIRRTIIPMTYYVVTAGLLGLLFSYALFADVF